MRLLLLTLALVGCLLPAASTSLCGTKTSNCGPQQARSPRWQLAARSFKPADGAKVCRTKACRWTAKQLLNTVDFGTNPCEDMHQFACGRLLASWPNSTSEQRAAMLESHEEARARLSEELKRLLDGAGHEPIEGHAADRSPVFKLLRRHYANCMDTQQLAQLGLAPLLELARSLGGWPALAGWNQAQLDWIDLLARCRQLGASHNQLLTLSALEDPRDVRRRLPTLERGYLDAQSKQQFENATWREEHLAFMLDLARRLNATDLDEAERQLRQVIDFERKLSRLSLNFEEAQQVLITGNIMSVAQLSRLAPHTDWLRLINGLIGNLEGVRPLGLEDEVNVLNSPKRLAQLDRLLHETPDEVLANLVVWRALDSQRSLLGDQQLGEQLQRVDRSDICLTAAKTGAFGWALAGLYARHKPGAAARERSARELIPYIKRASLARLERQSGWLAANSTLAEAKRKVGAAKWRLAHPRELLDDAHLERLLASLLPQRHREQDEQAIDQEDEREGAEEEREMGASGLLAAALASNKLAQDAHYGQLWGGQAREWTSDLDPLTELNEVEAYNVCWHNTLVLLAPLLAADLARPGRVGAMRFGTIGSVLAHEMWHSFDNLCRRYDAAGRLRNWWRPAEQAEFKRRTQCLVDQYEHFRWSESGRQAAGERAAEFKLDGRLSVGEDLADVTGVQVALEAYEMWAAEGPAERDQRLPGVRLTRAQLFWVAAAQLDCSAGPASPPHSSTRLRVNGAARNSAAFARHFQCPRGAPMNPGRKCAIYP